MIGAGAEQLNKALDEGVIKGVSAAYKDLVSRVREFKVGLKIIINNENLFTSPQRRWGRRKENLNEEVLQQGAAFLEEVTDQEGDPLKPLRSVLNRVVELVQLVEGFELKPTEANLRSISR